MKKSIQGLSVLVLFALSLAAPAAIAQDKQAVQLVVDIPWPFTVENTTLPAGRYMIDQARDMEWEWTIADAKGAVKVLFSTEPAEMAKPPKSYEATFDVVGDHHFLVSLWLASDTGGFYIPMTRSEKAVWKQGKAKAQEKVALQKR